MATKNLSFLCALTSGLIPGGGWAGATATPAAVGNSGAAGYGENAIARWDFVPYQTLTGTTNIGVVAFHMHGIARVEFSVDAGPWVPVSAMTLNPDSGVVEYHVPVIASRFADGLHELRARAYPVSGVPRVLSGMYFYANSGGGFAAPATLYVKPSTGSNSNPGTEAEPLETINAALDLVTSGGTVRLMEAGSYALALEVTSPRYAAPYNYARWTTIEADDSLDPETVILTGEGRIKINRLRLRNLTVDAASVYVYTEVGYFTWADRVAFLNSDGWTAEMTDGPVRAYQSGGVYYTDCSFYDMHRGPVGAALARNIAVERISGDLLQQNVCVISLTGSNLRNQIVGTHNDVCQLFGPHENVIVYGLTVTDADDFQGLFLDKDEFSDFRDVAIVNYSFTNNNAAEELATQFAAAERHVYLKNVSIPKQPMLWRTDFVESPPGTARPFVGTNFVLESVTVNAVTYAALQSPPSGVTVRSITSSGA